MLRLARWMCLSCRPRGQAESNHPELLVKIVRDMSTAGIGWRRTAIEALLQVYTTIAGVASGSTADWCLGSLRDLFRDLSQNPLPGSPADRFQGPDLPWESAEWARLNSWSETGLCQDRQAEQPRREGAASVALPACLRFPFGLDRPLQPRGLESGQNHPFHSCCESLWACRALRSGPR